METFSLILSVGLITAAAPEAILDARPRLPVVLHVTTPKTTSLHIPTSAILSAASRAASAHADLEIRSVEQSGIQPSEIDACDPAFRFSCWTRIVRRLSDPPRYLLVVAVLPTDATTARVTPMLVDTEQAEYIIDSAPAADDEQRELAESRIFERAIRAPPATVRSRGGEDLQRVMTEFFDRHMQDKLQKDRRDRTSGEIHVDSPVAGLTVILDGRVLGTTRSGANQIVNVRPGLRQLELTSPSGHRQLLEANVRPKEVVRLTAASPQVRRHLARTLTTWGGVGFATAGAILTTVGAVRGSEPLRTACLVRPGDSASCPSLGTPGFSFDPSGAPTTDLSMVDPGGPGMATVGSALLAGGITLGLGALLIGEDERPPWYAIGAGILAGSLTYIVAEAVDRR